MAKSYFDPDAFFQEIHLCTRITRIIKYRWLRLPTQLLEALIEQLVEVGSGQR